MRERLLELRKYFNMTQKEFGEKIGMTQSTYSPLENGREIRDSYVKLICNTYHINEDWFRKGVLPMFIDDRDKDFDELLTIFESFSPPLRKLLLKQAEVLQAFSNDLT